MDELRRGGSAYRMHTCGSGQRTFMMAGKRSLWMKYVRSVVWYAPDVTAKAASTALLRSPANEPVSIPFAASARLPSLTRLSVPHDPVERPHKLGKNRIDVVEAGNDGDDVGARVGVLLGEDGRQEDAQGLRDTG